MYITKYSPEAKEEIRSIHDGSFPFPDFNDPTYIIKDIVVDDGSIIGCGLVRVTTEFSMILDQSKPIRKRVVAISGLQKSIIQQLEAKGIRDVHVFANDNKVINYAERLGFEKCPEKSALSLRFGY